MAAPSGHDVAALTLELLRLERREQDLNRRLQAALERNERFPNPVTEREIERVRTALEPVLARLLELRVALFPYA
jgi:hypothetical protein